MRFIYIIVTVAFLDTFSQLPIIAPFAISLGATPLLIGIVIGMYSFSNIAGNIISGIWIDRRGPKQVLSIGMLSVAFILFLYSLVITPTQLIIVRFLHGLAGGLIVPAAFALLGSKDRKREKGKTMAFSGAAVGVAAIIGPAMGAIIHARFGIDWLFYLLSSLMVLFGCIVARFLPNNSESKKAMPKNDIQLNAGSIWQHELVHCYSTIFLLMFAQGILIYALPLKTSNLEVPSEMNGLLLSIFGIVAIAFFLLPTNKLFDKKEKQLLMKIGLYIIAVGLTMLAISETIFHLVVAMTIYGVGFAFIFPSTSGKVAEIAGENKRGRAFGVFYAFFSIGVIAGSIFAGLLGLNSSLVFIVASIIITLFNFVLSIFIAKKSPLNIGKD